VLFLAFVVAPAVAGLALSLYDWDFFGDPEFVGLDNFSRLISDPAMWASLGVSAWFVILGVVPTTVLAFLFAVLLNFKMRGIGILRVAYLTPLVASSAVAATIWFNVFQQRGGLLNQALSWVGVTGPSWLNDPSLALPCLVIVMIWSSLPLAILIYLSGLQRIPDDLYAAAALDGAGSWRQLWSITWPSVTGTTAVILVLEFVGFLTGSFEIALIMTDGGPLGTTTSLALYSYKTAFLQHDIGYASALSVFQLTLVGALVIAIRGISRGWRNR
jgi:multiple sugar transport system permease protein